MTVMQSTLLESLAPWIIQVLQRVPKYLRNGGLRVANGPKEALVAPTVSPSTSRAATNATSTPTKVLIKAGQAPFSVVFQWLTMVMRVPNWAASHREGLPKAGALHNPARLRSSLSRARLRTRE